MNQGSRRGKEEGEGAAERGGEVIAGGSRRIRKRRKQMKCRKRRRRQRKRKMRSRRSRE